MEEPGFSVVLTDDGSRGLDAIRAVRAVTGLSAWRSRELLDSAPATVIEETWFERAAEVASRLNAVGACTRLACDWCERVISLEDCPVDPAPCSSWPSSPCPASHQRP